MSQLFRHCLRTLLSVAVLSGAMLSGAMLAPAAAQSSGAAQGSGAAPGEMSSIEKIDGKTLKPATLAYDATVKTGDRSLDLSSTLTFATTSTGGTDTWTIVNKINVPQGTNTDSLIVDRSSLLPVSRHQSGASGVDLTYTDPSASGETRISGEMKTGGQSVQISKSFGGPLLAGGVHDVIALAGMPLTPDFQAAFRVFSPQDQSTKRAEFEVTGMETVQTPAGSFETYVVNLNMGDGYVTGTVYLRKKAPHYYVKWRTEVETPRGIRTVRQTLSSMAVPGR